MDDNNYYTQREWERVVGYGKVPDEYNIEKNIIPKDKLPKWLKNNV